MEQQRERNFSVKHPWSWLYNRKTVCPVMVLINCLSKAAVVKLNSCFAWEATPKQVAETEVTHVLWTELC